MLLVMVFVAVGGAGGDLVVMLVMGLVDLGLGWCGMTLVRGTCGRCNSSWVGADRCHCVRCCQTWDDVELFAGHRRGEVCVSGAVMGLARTRNGIWLRSEGGLGRAS
jgi:hypothetical protein